jgi:Outer membrane protein
MNKKLSLIIALAMSIGISSSALAAAPSVVAATTTTTTESTTTTVNTNASMNLTLEDALNNIEKSNTSIQLMDKKVLLLTKQYDRDHQSAIDASESLNSTNKNENAYISLKKQILITQQKSAQAVDDSKHNRENTLKSLKANMERQYMNVLNYQDQIKNINSTIENVDQQIEKVNANIKLGMATTDALQQLNVQRSTLVASLNTPKSKIEESILTVKQLLNIDLNTELVLSPSKKEFVKYDDSTIADIINKAVESSYDLAGINRNIEWAKVELDLNTKYGHNNTSGQVNAELSLQNLTNSFDNTKLTLQISAWTAYYNLKNKEDSITAEQINLKNAKENYDNAVVKFQTGQVNQLDVDSKKLALDKEELAVQSLVNEYMVTIEEFINLLTK